MDKLIVFCVLLMSLSSCSSDDNNEVTVEKSLLYGESWKNMSQTSTLKEILFNEDQTYRQIVDFKDSGSGNENSFGVIGGSFSISDNEITFDPLVLVIRNISDNNLMVSNLGVLESFCR